MASLLIQPICVSFATSGPSCLNRLNPGDELLLLVCIDNDSYSYAGGITGVDAKLQAGAVVEVVATCSQLPCQEAHVLSNILTFGEYTSFEDASTSWETRACGSGGGGLCGSIRVATDLSMGTDRPYCLGSIAATAGPEVPRTDAGRFLTYARTTKDDVVTSDDQCINEATAPASGEAYLGFAPPSLPPLPTATATIAF